MASAKKNFHVPLPSTLYEALHTSARDVGQPATRFAQELMQAGLEQWYRARRREQITAYARQVAGTTDDLDPALEQAGIDAMARSEIPGKNQGKNPVKKSERQVKPIKQAKPKARR
jgi:cytosine/adenosine deaminase-related metal-dependent hydrolase